MTPAWWHDALPAYVWQVALHSTILGGIFYAWARQVRLPSGRTRRRLLGVLLILPLITAAIPGRDAAEFRGRLAWFDSARVLVTPLAGSVRVYHVVLLVVALTLLMTIWQEVLPAMRRRRTSADAPPLWIVGIARGLPGWSDCLVTMLATPDVVVATSGWPRRPRLLVSRGALTHLSQDDMGAVIRHEHAHWRPGRWLSGYALFVVRLAQCHSPVALWAFREYAIEVEIACDAEAAGSDRRGLARILLDLYRTTPSSDVAAKSTLRKRVDVLLGAAPFSDADALPPATVAAAAGLMLLVLPWLV